MQTTPQHIPVLRDEVLTLLAPRDGGIYVDVTLGRGGHAEAILEACAPSGRLIAIDRDARALEESRPRLARFEGRVTFIHGAFGGLREHLAAAGAPLVDGLVADLGVSSPQLDDASRGFSFRASGPLDMRMDPSSGESARELISGMNESTLADLLFHYGDEKRSRPIARSIKRAELEGALETTDQLARAIWRVTGPKRGVGIDPATRTFQALRIAVNREIEQLEQLLEALPDVLNDGGRAALISFHSLEDRAVKHTWREDARLEVITKRPVEAGDTEASLNPRSRSAKLRGAARLPHAEDATRGAQ